jgi:chromosome segregation ATPase
MNAVAIDTHAYVKTLTATGMPEAQAEAVTTLVRQSWEVDRDQFATKADLAQLATKADLAQVRTELKSDLAELRTELKAGLADGRTELKAGLADVRTELAGVRTELKGDIAALQGDITSLRDDMTSLRDDMSDTKSEFRANFSTLTTAMTGLEGRFTTALAETKADLMKWMIGTVAGAVVINALTIVGALLATTKLTGH